jgi:hypothetical protein
MTPRQVFNGIGFKVRLRAMSDKEYAEKKQAREEDE